MKKRNLMKTTSLMSNFKMTIEVPKLLLRKVAQRKKMKLEFKINKGKLTTNSNEQKTDPRLALLNPIITLILYQQVLHSIVKQEK